MAVIALRFQPGDTLVIRSGGGIAIWRIVQRARSGWLLNPLDGTDCRTWSDVEINDVYRERRLVHQPCNIANLSAAAAEAMDRTWEYWRPEVRKEAERRLVYVQAAAEQLPKFRSAMDAFAEAARLVHAEQGVAWGRLERDDAVVAHKLAKLNTRRRKELVAVDFDQFDWTPSKPNPWTLRLWFRLWDKNGRDVRLLLPAYHRRGNRHSRFAVNPAEDEYDTYKCMDLAITQAYLSMPRRHKDYAFGEYKRLCTEKGVTEIASFQTFSTRIERKVDAYEEFRARYGSRAAYLRFHIFHRTKLPERPLEEVEVDHCIIDVFATHPVTGKNLGRPWLTVILDRATKVILGVHLSFMPPSYATLMRAMGHAMWPKDLTGIEGLLHDWPCHGVWDMLFTDNGKEFHSHSLMTSAALMQFTVVHLPAKHPWLKGAIERLWRTMGIQVYSLFEGAVLSKTPDHYDPVKRATMCLDEIRHHTVRWIVDDYHHKVHGTLKCTPMQRWLDLTDKYPVRPVADFDHVIRLTGESRWVSIQNTGVEINGHLYVDVDERTGAFGTRLRAMRSRRGSLKNQLEIRFDPLDLGEIWILDDEEGEWVRLPCTEPTTSRGVTSFQHRVHVMHAKRTAEPGEVITMAHIERAKAQSEADAQAQVLKAGNVGYANRAARYSSDPGYFTPMPFPGQPVHRPAPVQAEAAPLALPSPVPGEGGSLPATEVRAPSSPKRSDKRPAIAEIDFDALADAERASWN